MLIGRLTAHSGQGFRLSPHFLLISAETQAPSNIYVGWVLYGAPCCVIAIYLAFHAPSQSTRLYLTVDQVAGLMPWYLVNADDARRARVPVI